MTATSPRFGLTIPAEDGSDDANLAALLRSLGLDIENKMPGITALTAAARTALTGAAMFTGRFVYDTDDGYLYQGNGTTWVPLAKLDASKNLPMAGKKVIGLADGTAATDAVTKGQLDTAMPVGTVLNYAAASAPAGWLLCDGAAVSRSTYAALFALVGTTYGAGNGSTTFNVPDLRGRTTIGAGAGAGLTARTVGQTGGAETHQLALSEIPAHAHGGATGAAGGHSHNYSGTTGGGGNHTHGGYRINYLSDADDGGSGLMMGRSTDAATNDWSGDHTHGYSGATSSVGDHTHPVASDGGGNAHNNMPPWAALAYIIKAT